MVDEQNPPLVDDENCHREIYFVVDMGHAPL
jgi:hypothetical protein